MPKKPTTYRPHGGTRAEAERAYDRARGSAADRLYDWSWVKAAKAFLWDNPLCRYCALEDRDTAATLVDHFWPHKGNRVLFWRREFWVPSCDGCHSGMKQSVERQGVAALTALAARLGLPCFHRRPGDDPDALHRGDAEASAPTQGQP